MKATTSKTRVILVNSCQVPVWRGSFSLHDPEISVTVAALADDGAPRNWSFPYRCERFATDTGGNSARIYNSGDYGLVLTSAGRAISHSSNPDEYIAAAQALKLLDKRQQAMQATRGNTADAIEALGRWMEATGADRVMMRPNGLTDTGWLSEGAWNTLTPGQFIGLIRGMIRAHEEKTGEPLVKARAA